MRIAIVGGTGTLGRHLVEEVRKRGHEARALSRRSQQYPVDLITGAGLEAALEGCDAIIDASNSSSKAADVLVEGSRRLLAAEKLAGVSHHICVSIVGCDIIPMGYYRIKTEQERIVEHGDVPWSIVRATQFHSFVTNVFEQAGRWGIMPMMRMPIQSIAEEEAAAAVVDIAIGKPRRSKINVAGPEIVDARDLARIWKRAAGRRALKLPIPLPGKLGKALRAGSLTCQQPDSRGTQTFEQSL